MDPVLTAPKFVAQVGAVLVATACGATLTTCFGFVLLGGDVFREFGFDAPVAGAAAGFAAFEWTGDFDFAGCRAWLREALESSPEIIGIATWPFGVITIPPCFLLRAWILRLLGSCPRDGGEA